MNPYEVLGVPSDAGADDIKRAYRKKSSAAHPDKGGNDKDMADVNDAYAVLSDPARRKRFDECGDTDRPESVETQARAMLLGLFDMLLDDDDASDIIAAARRHIAEQKSGAISEKARLQAQRKKLEKRRGNVKTKTGENLVHMLIDQQVIRINASLAAIEHTTPIFDQARSMLEAYECEVDQQEIRTVKVDLHSAFADLFREGMNRPRDGGAFGSRWSRGGF